LRVDTHRTSVALLLGLNTEALDNAVTGESHKIQGFVLCGKQKKRFRAAIGPLCSLR